MKENVRCIFFDLDHTLWDYDTNARDTLYEMFSAFKLAEMGVPVFEHFFRSFQEVNFELWDLYDRGLIKQEVLRLERFKRVMAKFDVCDDSICAHLNNRFMVECPKKSGLMPGAHDTLLYLSSRYRLTIITNGFEEIQHMKIQSGKLGGYFDHVVTSQKAGCRKPNAAIFEMALTLNGVAPHEAVMIGDNPLTDISGAKNAGLHAVWLDAAKSEAPSTADFRIQALEDLKQIL